MRKRNSSVFDDSKGTRSADVAKAEGKMQRQNRIPVREIRTFESKMPLPVEDFDDATLEVNENQRRFRERRRFAVFLKFANRKVRKRNRRHSREIRTSSSNSKQDFHRFR